MGTISTNMSFLSVSDSRDAEYSSQLQLDLPAAQRAQLLRALIDSLQPDDKSSAELIASLLAQTQDETLQALFKDAVHRSLMAGHMGTAIAACTKYPPLTKSLLCDIASQLQRRLDNDPDINFLPTILEFSARVCPNSPFLPSDSTIFRIALESLESSNERIVVASRNVVFKFLSICDREEAKSLMQASADPIWRQIVSLCSRTDATKSRSALGFSLWLRWVINGMHIVPSELIDNEYWSLLEQGLRFGDNEIRKTCLAILRISTMVSSLSVESQEQYGRFCTLFETILLSRYMNQVQECENDLTFLASSQSQLPSSWLFALLGAAMNPNIQFANRKFIGNWAMRAELPIGPKFFAFFESDFLPWAMLGQNFVSSLKSVSGSLRCLHGDSLVSMITRLIKAEISPGMGEIEYQTKTADTIIDTLNMKRNSVFSYAVVYLLSGIGRHLTATQKAKLETFPFHRLPEVVRVGVSMALGEWITTNPSAGASRRRQLEEEAKQKCQSMLPNVTELNDIWSDLDYLEYPRDLLMLIPQAIVTPKFVDQALQDQELASSLQTKFTLLQSIAKTKTFLLAPLACSVRHTILACPKALSILNIEQFFLQLANDPPEAVIDLLLDEATINFAGLTYERYLGERPKVGFAAYLDLASRLSPHQNLAKSLLRQLIEPWLKQKVPPLTVSAWKNILQLQLIFLCCEQVDQTRSEADGLLKEVYYILGIEPLPGYRHILEWTCMRLAMRYDLQDNLVDLLSSNDHHANPKLVASLMKIGCNIACSPQAEERFAERLATAFVPLAASSKVVIRHEAQWQLPTLMDHAAEKGWTSVSGNPAFVALDGYIRSLQRYIDSSLERSLSKFDPQRDQTLTNLVEGPWHYLDHIGSPVTSREDLLKIYATDPEGCYGTLCCLPLGEHISHSRLESKIAAEDNTTPDLTNIPGPRTLEQSTALQTKGTAYLARSLLDPDAVAPRPTEVLVVASLVDNPYNLGGLSRASEIFGAAALTLQNQNVLGNRDFTGVSVSSHLHFPIIQLSAKDIPTWLAERRTEGYTVVGIEQTDRSVVLGSPAAQLPSKVVLVVGSEREGIPAVILGECDILVEIPQRGVTRSLNVQTAAAVVLFEHSRQHPRII